MERYLTDHGEAVAKIGRLAQLLARLVWAIHPEQRTDPTVPLELAVIAQMAAQRPSVQCAAARPHPCSYGGCSCTCEQTR